MILDVDRSITEGGPLAELLGDRESVEVTHFTDKLIADVAAKPAANVLCVASY